jgi:antitoxin component of RelBE/YafQ-DinJ toxin-antitoxin module
MKKQVCVRLDESLVKEMQRVKEETGVPLSQQIELRLKGYDIRKKLRMARKKKVKKKEHAPK